MGLNMLLRKLRIFQCTNEVYYVGRLNADVAMPERKIQNYKIRNVERKMHEHRKLSTVEDEMLTT